MLLCSNQQVDTLMKPSVIYLLHFCGVTFVNYICKVFIELSKDPEFFIIGHLLNGTSNGQDRLSEM